MKKFSIGMPVLAVNMRRNQRGFTLTEIIVSLLITGVGVGLFFTVFTNNWMAYEDSIKRANLWNEANRAFEVISRDGRNARTIQVSPDQKTATLTHVATGTDTVYSLTNDGRLTRLQNGVTTVLGSHFVFANSSFIQQVGEKSFIINVRLEDIALTRTISITTATEILSRN